MRRFAAAFASLVAVGLATSFLSVRPSSRELAGLLPSVCALAAIAAAGLLSARQPGRWHSLAVRALVAAVFIAAVVAVSVKLVAGDPTLHAELSTQGQRLPLSISTPQTLLVVVTGEFSEATAAPLAYRVALPGQQRVSGSIERSRSRVSSGLGQRWRHVVLTEPPEVAWIAVPASPGGELIVEELEVAAGCRLTLDIYSTMPTPFLLWAFAGLLLAASVALVGARAEDHTSAIGALLGGALFVSLRVAPGAGVGSSIAHLAVGAFAGGLLGGLISKVVAKVSPEPA